jgi:hypothetical protein
MRLIDLMCDWHRQFILDVRLWPVGYKPGGNTNCGNCLEVTRLLPPAAVRPFPEFGREANEAIHESGHVVVALAHGFVVDYLALEPSGRSGSTAHWAGRTTERATLNSAEFAEVTLAGEAAGRYWLTREGEASAANLIDAAFGGLLDVEDLEAMDWGGSAAVALKRADISVTEHWAAIERVAEALMDRRRLDGTEVAELAGLACGTFR